ncbi:hypothetical protein GYMLUDRAFT_71948 [Collybiopsis luxurians FD-317 M1]|uniref:Polynucleotide kinase 3'-phosphatase n=1 Tax=Collybiopsis luxurians FD-317 M1 TaxID=944289 RepID=A0A0D0CVT0_9AGAR|nr:hypothetical protein GYMLUDRAFT_71948 [Collybiopsis luxurians FD-317 M1]
MSSALKAGPSNSSKKRPLSSDADDHTSSLEGSSSKAAKIHPFFSKGPQESSQSGAFQWHKPLGIRGTCLYATNLSPQSFSKVAAFDLDGTLIKAVKKASKGSPPGWEWWRRDKVPNALKDLSEQGYSVAIISNQALKSAQLITWKEKIALIAAALPSVPFRLFAASAKDGFRKPMPGMWNELSRIFKEDGVEIDKTASFYVGDAAGRHGDFASTDRMWALNVELPFFTPEEYFLKQPTETKFKLGFDVTALPTLPLFSPNAEAVIPEPPQQEVVLFVGYPGVGKSTIHRRYFAPVGYQRINQDTLGSREKCVKAVEEALRAGLSCVVDNTNRDKQTRKLYVSLAQHFKIPIRCFLFTGSRHLAWHNNLYRALNLPPSLASREEKRELVPEIAYTTYENNFEEPSISEGFSEIRKVNWVFEGTGEERKYWSMWLQL